MLVQILLQSEEAREQTKPCFLQENFMVFQLDLHLIEQLEGVSEEKAKDLS